MATNNTSTNDSNKAATLWDYEAPQYCDFTDQQTFKIDNPEDDKFFLTDHDSKENISSEDIDTDSDMFQTPMSVRDVKNVNSVSSNCTNFYSPNVNSKSETNTPLKKRQSNYLLRQTPLRELYQTGETPLYIPGQNTKQFGSRKSVVKSCKKGQFNLSKTVNFENNLNNTTLTPSKRDTFDVTEIVAEKLLELNITEEVVDIEVQNVNKLDAIETAALLSEDDDEENLNQTICENKSIIIPVLETEEKEVQEVSKVNETEVSIEQPSNAEFHTITDKELEENEQNSTLAANTSRRSSYVVRSPSVRAVHFNEDSIVTNKLDTIGENEKVTPTFKPSETSKKIKSRQKTPLSQTTVTKKTSVSFNARFNKYIKRFSKTLDDKDFKESESDSNSISETKNVEKVKKRVTISVPNNTTKPKRPIPAKSFSFRQSLKALKGNKPRPSVTVDTVEPKNSPYLGLAVLNNKFMNSVRHYSPFLTGKPKVTIPKAPRLLTEQRMGVRKYNTTTVSSATPIVDKPEPSKKKPIAPKPVSSKVNHGTKHFTKAISPHFSTDNRIKVWHSKHDGQTQVDGAQVTNPITTMFKARPAPNFKKLQALEDKRKKEAFEKAKHTIRHSKAPQFSFESRAHSVAPAKNNS